MALPIIEVPSGAVDDSNVIFTTSQPYVAGTLSVFVNGLLFRADWADGWTETDPAAGTVTLKIAPMTGDSVQVYFIPAVGGMAETSVTVLRAVLDVEATDLVGNLQVTQSIRATMKCGCP